MSQTMNEVLLKMCGEDNNQNNMVESIRKKFSKFYNIVCCFDFNQEIKLSNITEEAYDYFSNEMINLTKKYTINNISNWININNGSQLYCIDKNNIMQLEFYHDFRVVLFEMFKREHKTTINTRILNWQSTTEDIYSMIHMQIEKIKGDGATDLVEEETVNELKVKLDDLKEFEREGAQLYTKREIIMMIVEVQEKLMELYRKKPQPYKVAMKRLQEDYKKYKDKYIKELHFPMTTNDLFMEYLKRSLIEEKDLFPYELDPNDSDLFERCLRKYKLKNTELINSIIEETRLEIKEEIREQQINEFEENMGYR